MACSFMFPARVGLVHVALPGPGVLANPGPRARIYFTGGLRVRQSRVKPNVVLFGSMLAKTRMLEEYAGVYSGIAEVRTIPLSYGDIISRGHRERSYASVAVELRKSTGDIQAHVLSAGYLHLFFFSKRYPDIAKRMSSVVLDSPLSLHGLRGALRSELPPFAGSIADAAARLLLNSNLPAIRDAAMASRSFRRGPPPNLRTGTRIVVIYGGEDRISPKDAISGAIASWGCRSQYYETCGHVQALQRFPGEYRETCRSLIRDVREGPPRSRA